MFRRVGKTFVRVRDPRRWQRGSTGEVLADPRNFLEVRTDELMLALVIGRQRAQAHGPRTLQVMAEICEATKDIRLPWEIEWSYDDDGPSEFV
jgi:hypothetical protein